MLNVHLQNKTASIHHASLEKISNILIVTFSSCQHQYFSLFMVTSTTKVLPDYYSKAMFPFWSLDSTDHQTVLNMSIQ
jgi:uncharacterized protein (UPF0333 family)